MLIFGFFVIFWQFLPKREGQNPAPAFRSIIVVLATVGVIFVACLATIALPLLRNFDRGVRRAEKRARDGDLDGAIADLREYIEGG
jgi:hypothetical protein